MRDELLTCYERELTYIRRLAAEFAEKYPKIAGRLQLERGKCEDPHVERLIEAFAFLAARIHLKIDDELPEITESLLEVLYPHYLAPVPSMSIVQLELDPDQGRISTGYRIDRHRTLYAKPSQDTVCRFRTCYPVTLWPIEIASAHVESPPSSVVDGRTSPAALVLRLRTLGDATFRDLEIPSLRFFLAGESRVAYQIYEAIFGSSVCVELRSPDRTEARTATRLPPDSLSEVGFDRDEGLLPYSPRSFLGYRLLQEYFQFPEKFLFVDVRHLERLREVGADSEVELAFLLDRVPQLDERVDAQSFRLGCTPIINLFQQVAEPIRLDHAHTEYRVVPDVRRQMTTEVYSVDAVTSLSPATGTTRSFEPFYSFKHAFGHRTEQAFWHAARRPSARKEDAGTEVYLSLVDLDFRPTRPPTDSVTVHVTCTNRDLAGRLPFGDVAGDFDLEGAAPVKAVRCLTKPTPTLRLPLRHGTQWRLISHLSLNYLSPVEWGGGTEPEVLQELLRLYDFTGSPVVQQQIAGITSVGARQVMRRIRSRHGSGFARGVEATIELDESKFVGSGVYLFSSLIEKFLGLYVSMNSFSELVVKTHQRGLLKHWSPRAGAHALL